MTKAHRIFRICCIATLLSLTLSLPVYAQLIYTHTTPANTHHEMVLIPAGEFLMGLNPEQEEWLNEKGWGPGRLQNEKPLHTVFLSAYYIDRFEVTNAQYRAFAEHTGNTLSPFAGDSEHNDPLQPVIGITWFEARDYCQWAGLHLPTEAEWEKAARGSDGRTYPWGEEIDERRANYSSDGSPLRGKATPVGSFPLGASPYGVHDMAGNVEEWVVDWYSEEYYAVSPKCNPEGWNPDSPYGGTHRVVRGGSWLHAPSQVRASFRDAREPATKYSQVPIPIGFRCARPIVEQSAPDCRSDIPIPQGWVPGKIEIVLKASSFPNFDREGVLQGKLITGLATLDSLNQHEGLLAIEASYVSPQDSLLSPRLVYLLIFPLDADLPRLVQLYAENEHIEAADPVRLGITTVELSSWGKIKQSINRSR